MKLLKFLFVILFVVIVFSCASMEPAGPEDYQRVFPGKGDILFDAAQKTLFEYNAQITDSSKENGFINAKYIHTSAMNTALTGNSAIEIRYNINILEDTIKVKILTVSGNSMYNADKYSYTNFWNAFEKYL